MNTQCPFTYYQCTPGSKGDHILMYLFPLLYYIYIYVLVLQLLGTKALFGTFVFPTEPKPTWIWDCLWIVGDQYLFFGENQVEGDIFGVHRTFWGRRLREAVAVTGLFPPQWLTQREKVPPHLSYSESVIPPWLSWKCSTLASQTLTPKGKNGMPRSHHATNTFRLAN